MKSEVIGKSKKKQMLIYRRTERQSNLELLRILAAMAVIVLHYNNGSMGNAFGLVIQRSINHLFLSAAECLCISAVNVFVLLSGFFLHQTPKRDLLRPVQLLMQLIITELAFCMALELPKENGITMEIIHKYFTPIYWFIFVYIALYLISPWISITFKRQRTRNQTMILTLCLSLFSMYPFVLACITSVSGLEWKSLSTVGLNVNSTGSTLTHFVLLYLVGAWLSENQEWRPPFYVIVAILLFSVTVLTVFTFKGNLVQLRYENPLVIILTVAIFLLFQRLRLGSNRIINMLARGSFPCYLIHVNLLGYCRIEDYVNQTPWKLIIHMGCTVLLIYLISFGINVLYHYLMNPLLNLLETRWNSYRWYEAD